MFAQGHEMVYGEFSVSQLRTPTGGLDAWYCECGDGMSIRTDDPFVAASSSEYRTHLSRSVNDTLVWIGRQSYICKTNGRIFASGDPFTEGVNFIFKEERYVLTDQPVLEKSTNKIRCFAMSICGDMYSFLIDYPSGNVIEHRRLIMR